MPTEPLLDFDALVRPVPGDNPAGQPLEDLHGIRTALDAARPPKDDLENEAKADWPKVIQVAKETLTDKSKDLLVAVRLTEALTRKRKAGEPSGFAGLRDSLILLKRLCEECWDRMYPEVEYRSNQFVWLNDRKRSSLLPQFVATTPLVQVDDQSFHLFDWQDEKKREQCQRVLDSAKREDVQKTVEDLEGCRDALNALQKVLDRPDRLGPGDTEETRGRTAPGLTSEGSQENLGWAVRECLRAATFLLEKKGGRFKPGGDANGAKTDNEDSKERPSGRRGGASNREELYARLAETADELRRLEPHSPIPFLILRCVALGRLEFPDLMKRIIRTEGALGEIDRLLGADDVAAAPPAEGGEAAPGGRRRQRPPGM